MNLLLYSPLGSRLRVPFTLWVSWWKKRNLGRFITGFLFFFPSTNFIPPFRHTHLIHFVSFHPPLWWCIRRRQPASLLFTDLQLRVFIASHPLSRLCVGHELKGLFPKWRISNFWRFGAEHSRALSIPSSMVSIMFFVENDVNTSFRSLWKFVLFPKWRISQLCLFPKSLISSWPIGTRYAITWPPNVSWRL